MVCLLECGVLMFGLHAPKVCRPALASDQRASRFLQHDSCHFEALPSKTCNEGRLRDTTLTYAATLLMARLATANWT